MTDETLERYQAIALFTRQFAMLVDGGLSLVRILLILEQEAPPPLNAYMPDLRAQVEAGHPLSKRMALRADLFSTFYIKMIRVGEIGGILEETLRYLADFLEEEWKLLRLSGQQPQPSLLFLPADQPVPQDWTDLSDTQRKLTLMLFCRTLSALLSAGVPMRLLLETLAEMLPTTQREAVRALAQSDLMQGSGGPPIPPPKVQQGRFREHTDRTPHLTEPLAKIGFLPSLVTQLMSVGEQAGHLDQAMDKAAQFYQYELQYRLLGGNVAGRA